VTTTQNEEILGDLLKGRRITPLDALHDYGCNRLGARIYELRRMGYDIGMDLVCVPTTRGRAHVACYYME
jgi:hypothetical protein